MRYRIQIGLGAVLGTVFPEAVLASSGGGGPFTGDIGNALWTLVIFLLVVGVLGKYAWGPLLAALQSREDFIRQSLEEAQQEREDATKLLEQYKEQLETARSEATAIVEEGRRDAEEVQRKIKDDTAAEAEKTLARAKREIEIAKESALKELYGRSADLATDLAGRIIRKELDAADHARLVSEAIGELENRS